MRSSYKKEDVVFLLKDITGLVEPQPTKERERLIQSGRHYCEMLPIEYVPSEKYMEVYKEALKNYSKPTAAAIETLGDKILKKKGKEVVLVSLARAGTPIGILVKRYLKKQYELEVPHYSISIIRGRGIDDNAMKFLLEKYQPEQILFVDGWIGKGAILRELQKDLSAYPQVSSDIAVVADPAGVTELCGTHEDILIPSSCLNCTVSGLVSHTFLREDIIKEGDYHGAVYYGELEAADLSYEFIQAIEKQFGAKKSGESEEVSEGKEESKKEKLLEKEEAKEEVSPGMKEVKKIATIYKIKDINFIKPGIGETTRVLLRRIPFRVLISEQYRNDPALAHIVRLAEEKKVPLEYYPLIHYKACGIIKNLADA